MKYCNVVLRPDEKAIYELRSLYLGYGYRHYKVGKFEEYDLYASNKSFLKGDSILTFTDTDGKLMALKPDVTLSIIKNIADHEGETYKYFYNENVYRTSASSGSFREIMQTGLECIGNVDIYATCEVLTLADESLKKISSECLLALSHMGFVTGLLEECKFNAAQQTEALGYIACKNVSALKSMAEKLRIYSELCEALVFVAKFYGKLSDAIEQMERFCFNDKMSEAYRELESISRAISTRTVYADFSLVNDMNYYNGIIFKGYINGIPESILSGGRYDSLVHKMGKKAGALGFAVYLDLLERFYEDDSDGYDADVLLLYSEKEDASNVMRIADGYVAQGKTVRVLRERDEKKYKTVLMIYCGEVKVLEEND